MITAEQLEQRRRHIGSSDVPAILGLSPWATPYDVYLSKTHEIEQATSAAIDIGNRFEAPVLDWAEDQLEQPLERDVQIVSAVKPLFLAHLDARVKNQPEGVEAKTAGVLSPWGAGDQWGADLTDEIPQAVIAQVMQQMYCGDLDRVWVPALLGGGRGLTMFLVERDDAAIKAIVDLCEAWWERHVVAQVPPTEGPAPSLDLVKRIRRTSTAIQIEEALVEAWLAAVEDEKAAGKNRDEAQARLLAALGDAEVGTYSGGMVTYYEQARKSVDGKALAAAHPDIYAEVLRETHYRVARHKKG